MKTDLLFEKTKAAVDAMCFDSTVDRSSCLSNAKARKAEIDKMIKALRQGKVLKVIR